eukprot:UN09498
MNITKEKIFQGVYNSVWKVVIPHFTQFLRHSYENDKKKKFDVKIPFKLSKNWIIEWDKQLTKQTTKTMKLADTAPAYNNSNTLLSSLIESTDVSTKGGKDDRSSLIQHIQLTRVEAAEVGKVKGDGDGIVIVTDNGHKSDNQSDKVAVIIE